MNQRKQKRFLHILRHHTLSWSPSTALIKIIVLLLVASTHPFPSAFAASEGQMITSLAGSSFTSSSKQNTLFLPLKINSVKDSNTLALTADETMGKTLASKDLTLIPRDVAAMKLDYSIAWPPSFKELRKFSPPAGTDYVAAGSLTRLGHKISIDIIIFDILAEGAPTYFYKSADTINDLPEVMNQIIGEILSFTGRYFQIAVLEITGNERIDSGAILRNINSRTGDRYEPDKLSQDIKNIFKMGYFEDIKIDVSETDKGKKIVFRVVEKDVIGQVLIVDNDELEDDEIRDVISVKVNNIINSEEVRKSIEKIRFLYKEKGFYNTKVSAKLSHPKEGRVDVRFVIEEGEKVYIKEVKFVGNKAFQTKRLKKIIETSERWFMSWLTESGLLKRDIVEQDAARIAAYYHNNGYIDAKVGIPDIRQEENWLYISFNISEGERYQVGKLDLSGELIEEKGVLLNMTSLGSNDFFSRRLLRQDILRLTDFYAEKGYAFAEAKPIVHKDATAKKIDVEISLYKGDLVYVNRIIIKGNTRTRDKVIRRELTLQEREIFDATALKKSHEKLQRLQFFEDVTITPEPAMDDTLMDIVIDMKEKPTGTFSIGAGYSSVDSFMFMGEISQNNFMGRGQRLALQANFSGTSTRYNLSFTEPRLNDSQLLFGFDLYDWEKEYDDYTKDSQGFTVRFGYPVWEKWKAYWSYGYDKTDLTDVDLPNASTAILESLDINVTSYAKLGFVRDTRNHPFNPTKGTQHRIDTKYAGGPFGGDSYFTKMQGATNWYFPFYRSTTFHLKGAAGYVTENSGGKLPVYEKFYLGGISTIRGFKSGNISPKDPLTGDRIGGDKMWYYNSEIIFPLVKDAGLNGVVFLDAGNVYATEDDWDFSNIKKSAGVGFRWLSPMGPLRLEWGYNLDRVDDEDQDNWDFSIGGAF